MKFFRSEKQIFFVLCFLLWIYLWLRASHLPFLFDESTTFQRYVHTFSFLPPGILPEANNHLLNSALTCVSYYLFGSSELALRLPSLLFAPVFFIYWFKISGMIRDRFFRILFLVTFFFSAYFIEFFSLCRGYGISMALMAGAFYHSLRYLETRKISSLLFSLFFLALANLANLTLINTNILIIGYFGISILFFSKESFVRKLSKTVLLLALGIFPVILCALLLFWMKSKGMLYYGTNAGFLDLTVKSLVAVICESKNQVFFYYALFLFGFTIFTWLLHVRRLDKPFDFFSNSNFFIFLLIGNIMMTILISKLFKTNYPEDRAGLYFFPILIASFCFLGSEIKRQFLRDFSRVIAIPLLLLPIHFVFGLNLNYSSYYHGDQIPARFYNTIRSYTPPGEAPPTVGGYRLRLLNWYFLALRNDASAQAIHYGGYPGTIEDFQIACAEDFPQWRTLYDSIDYEKASNFVLFKRKQFLARQHWRDTTSIQLGKNSSEYVNLFLKKGADSLIGKNILCSFDLTVSCEQKPFMAWVVACVKDKDWKDLRYEFLALDWLRTSWDGKKSNLRNAILVHDIPKGADAVVVYLWNQNKVPVTVADGMSRVDVLEERQ